MIPAEAVVGCLHSLMLGAWRTCSGQEYGYTMSTWYYPTYRTGNVASHIIPISLTNPLVCRVGFYDPSEHFGASYALPGYIAALRVRSTYLTQVRSEPLARVFFNASGK